MNPSDAAQIIQYTLAPAVMISSAALLLLGLQNKFSNLFNRFRMLNQERRLLTQKKDKPMFENERLENLRIQLERLAKRTSFVKNAIVLLDFAIGCFVLTSVCLFLSRYGRVPAGYPAVALFLAGMFCLLAAVFFMMKETQLANRILQLEAKS